MRLEAVNQESGAFQSFRECSGTLRKEKKNCGGVAKKTKHHFNVLPRRALRGDRRIRLDTTLSNRVASSSHTSNSGTHRTGAK